MVMDVESKGQPLMTWLVAQAKSVSAVGQSGPLIVSKLKGHD